MEEEKLNIEDVKAKLAVRQDGKMDQSVDNYVKVLTYDPDLCGAIKVNELTGQKDIVKDLWWKRVTQALTDVDLDFIYHIIETRYGLRNDKLLKKALNIVSNENGYHPIKDYLEELEWDGEKRIEKLLPKYLGAEENDITAWATKTMMLGLLKRIYEPGCKFELMLCLVGGQGAGKSSFFRLLAIKDEWFTDDLRKIDDENVYRKIKGHWVIELAEMIATLRSKYIEDIKSFISRQVDVYKVPYEVHPKDFPRQCAFVGSSNNMEFLPFDRSGNRRFIPIMIDAEKAECHPLENEAECRQFIINCWAEALSIYKSGDYSFVVPEEIEDRLKQSQKEFMPEDDMTGRIGVWLDNCNETYVCTDMIYQGALAAGINERPERYIRKEIAEVMNSFNGCVSLSSVPVLNATTLADWCYFGMFRGCTNLKVINTINESEATWKFPATSTRNWNLQMIDGLTADGTVTEVEAEKMYIVTAIKDIQTLSASNVIASYGDTDKKVTVTNNRTDGGSLSYEVTDGTDVIEVDESGNITIKKVGNAIVKITAAATETYAVAEKSITVTVNKYTPAVPNAVAIAPTSASAIDGKITGVDTTMEYATYNAATSSYGAYENVTGTEITDLAAGTKIKVRVKAENDNCNPSADKELTVPAYKAPTPPSGGGGGYYAPSIGGGSTSENNNSNTTTTNNPDGSTTTITENPDGSTATTTKNTDGSTTEVTKAADGTTTTVDTAKDGSSVKTVEKTTTNKEGETVENIVITNVDANGKVTSSTEITKNADGSSKEVTQAVDGTTTTVDTAKDGSSVKTVEQTTTNKEGKTVENTVVTNINAEGKVTGSTETSKIAEVAPGMEATVVVAKTAAGEVSKAIAGVKAILDNPKSVTFAANTIAQLIEAASGKNIIISLSVYGGGTLKKLSLEAENDKPLYTVNVDSSVIKANTNLKIFMSKDDNYYAVNNKNYKVDKDGSLQLNITSTKGNTFELVDTKTANSISKEILKEIKPAKTSLNIKKGKNVTMKLADSYATSSVKSITYTTSNKKVATVNKNGKITAKKAGKVIVKALVTLKNGKTKTVKTTVKIK